MKLFRKIIILGTFLVMGYVAFAQQKQAFDILTYHVPANWKEAQTGGLISYSRIDGSSWAQIALYRHRASEGDIRTDFEKDWNELVAAGGRSISSVEKTAPQTAEGWTVMSGSGVWQYNGANVAVLLTVYSNKSISVSVLCNATALPYLRDYNKLIGTLELNADVAKQDEKTVSGASASNNKNGVSLVGLWTDYDLETSGYTNGLPMYSAGYFRKEYAFHSDGTYLFRLKNWSTLMKEILFVYETGTYTVSGNQLTITPRQGKGGWWSKQDNNTRLWGNNLKTAAWKLEPVTYTFDLHYYAGTNETNLILQSDKPTEREGRRENNRSLFKPKALNQSLIDNPPGFKAPF